MVDISCWYLPWLVSLITNIVFPAQSKQARRYIKSVPISNILDEGRFGIMAGRLGKAGQSLVIVN